MTDPQGSYQSFLLRLRQADNAGCPVWRISLERPGQPGQVQFESLTALCAYLANQMQISEGKEGGDSEADTDQSSNT